MHGAGHSKNSLICLTMMFACSRTAFPTLLNAYCMHKRRFSFSKKLLSLSKTQKHFLWTLLFTFFSFSRNLCYSQMLFHCHMNSLWCYVNCALFIVWPLLFTSFSFSRNLCYSQMLFHCHMNSLWCYVNCALFIVFPS